MSVLVEINDDFELDVEYEFIEGYFKYQIIYINGWEVTAAESSNFIESQITKTQEIKIERACEKDFEKEIRLRQEDSAVSRYYDKHGY